MESHEPDPRETNEDDPWRQASERWSELSDHLKERYHAVAGESGPSETEVRDALRTLGAAAQTVIDSLGDAMNDPEVRSQAKEAASGFVSAMGQTLTDLGEELRKATTSATDEEDDDAAAADVGAGSEEE